MTCHITRGLSSAPEVFSLHFSPLFKLNLDIHGHTVILSPSMAGEREKGEGREKRVGSMKISVARIEVADDENSKKRKASKGHGFLLSVFATPK